MRRPKLFPHVAAVGMAVLTALGLPFTARAQHTPDPYNIVGEYNVGYEDSMYPTYPNGAGMSSNQAILQGRVGPRANTFQSYLDGLDGGGLGSMFGSSYRSRGGAGVPYYRAHKEFDDAFDRIYTPNAAPDQAFRADQEARTKLYVEYLKEADPKKRAQLYRLYNQQSLRTARDSGAGSARAALRNRNSSSTRLATPPTLGRHGPTHSGSPRGCHRPTLAPAVRPPRPRRRPLRRSSNEPSAQPGPRATLSGAD